MNSFAFSFADFQSKCALHSHGMNGKENTMAYQSISVTLKNSLYNRGNPKSQHSELLYFKGIIVYRNVCASQWRSSGLNGWPECVTPVRLVTFSGDSLRWHLYATHFDDVIHCTEVMSSASPKWVILVMHEHTVMKKWNSQYISSLFAYMHLN